MESNVGGILASYNVHTKAPLEPDGDKWIQVELMLSLTHVELFCPLTSLPTYATPNTIDTYIILFSK